MLTGTQPSYLKYKYFNNKQKAASSPALEVAETTSEQESNWETNEGITGKKTSYATSTTENDEESDAHITGNSMEENLLTLDGNETKDITSDDLLGTEGVASTSSSPPPESNSELKTELTHSKPRHKTKQKSASQKSSTAVNNTVSDRSNSISDIPPPSARVLGVSNSTYNIHSMTGTEEDTAKGKSQFSSWLGKSKKLPPTTGMKDGGPLVNLVNPQRTLSKELKNLVNNPDFCDVVFILEDKPLYAHRALLSARCPKFQQMFNTMKDARPEIQIPNIRYATFLGMMQFLYTDSVDISLELCLELLGAATQFSLDLLKSLCERILEQSINVENVGWIFQGADRYKATRLREICLSFIVKSFDNVSKTKAFEELNRDLILEVIKKR